MVKWTAEVAMTRAGELSRTGLGQIETGAFLESYWADRSNI
jgi:hypothetical protein